MSVTSIPSSDSTSQFVNHALQQDIHKDNTNFQLRRLDFLIPTIASIAMGSFFIPNFALGMGIGGAVLTVSIVGSIFYEALFDNSKSEEQVSEAATSEKCTKRTESEYRKAIRKNLFYTNILGPIFEESYFREGMLPLFTSAVSMLVPTTTAILFGPLSTATVISVIATGIIFGALHFRNPHDNIEDKTHQAFHAGITGIILGFTCAYFGFGAAVGAHIANNSLIGTIVGVATAFQPEDPIQVAKLDRPKRVIHPDPIKYKRPLSLPA